MGLVLLTIFQVRYKGALETTLHTETSGSIVLATIKSGAYNHREIETFFINGNNPGE